MIETYTIFDAQMSFKDNVLYSFGLNPSYNRGNAHTNLQEVGRTLDLIAGIHPSLQEEIDLTRAKVAQVLATPQDGAQFVEAFESHRNKLFKVLTGATLPTFYLTKLRELHRILVSERSLPSITIFQNFLKQIHTLLASHTPEKNAEFEEREVSIEGLI